MKVTVDRISSSGNPIAVETFDGRHIHPMGASVGETVEIRLEEATGFYIGHITDPTQEQVRRKQELNLRRKKKKGTWKWKPTRGKPRKEKTKKSWKEPNKNHLLGSDL